RLHGLAEMIRDDPEVAAQHFGRSVSIFDLLGDRYRAARAYYELGKAYALCQPERAAEQLARAVNTFRELGAKLDLERAEAATRDLERAAAPITRHEHSAIPQLLTLRLTEAVASRALLLRELAAVIHQETNAKRIVIVEPEEEGRQHVVVAYGVET